MSEWLIPLICALIAAASAILVAKIEADNKKERKRTEERAKVREKESHLSMKMMSAAIDLGFVTSLAVTGGHTNGNVEAAQKKAQAAQKEYEDFLRETAAHIIAE